MTYEERRKLEQRMRGAVDKMIAERNLLEEQATLDALHERGYEVFKWNPYPAVSPLACDDYLVTVAYDLAEKCLGVDIWTYCKDAEFRKVGYMGIPEAHVVAWARMPNPMAKEVRNDAVQGL